MSKLKKLVAGALAAVVCATSFSAPATADAADYCCHTIYRASSVKVDSDSVFCSRVPIGGHWNAQGTAYWVTYGNCYLKTDTYHDTYACYKCNYTYTGYHTQTYHTHSH